MRRRVPLVSLMHNACEIPNATDGYRASNLGFLLVSLFKLPSGLTDRQEFYVSGNVLKIEMSRTSLSLLNQIKSRICGFYILTDVVSETLLDCCEGHTSPLRVLV
jgi:hypothetical protein